LLKSQDILAKHCNKVVYGPQGNEADGFSLPINGKRDDFFKDGLILLGKEINIKSIDRIIDDIVEVVSNWPKLAKDTGVEASRIKSIGKTHRLLSDLIPESFMKISSSSLVRFQSFVYKRIEDSYSFERILLRAIV